MKPLPTLDSTGQCIVPQHGGKIVWDRAMGNIEDAKLAAQVCCAHAVTLLHCQSHAFAAHRLFFSGEEGGLPAAVSYAPPCTQALRALVSDAVFLDEEAFAGAADISVYQHKIQV